MCFLLNSFFISSADSNNSKIVSRVAFGVIKEVGRIAVSTVLIGLDTYSLIDFGMYIYNSLTEEQQQELNDSYGTEEFEGKVLDSIDSLGQTNSRTKLLSLSLFSCLSINFKFSKTIFIRPNLQYLIINLI